MKSIAEFDATLKKLCENDDNVFGNWCLTWIMIFSGTIAMPLCATMEFIGFIGFIAPAYMLCTGVRVYMESKLLYSTDKGRVHIYSVLKNTPLKKEDFIKDRRKKLFCFVLKLAVAGAIIGFLMLVIPEKRNVEYVFKFLVRGTLIYILAILLGLISIRTCVN